MSIIWSYFNKSAGIAFCKVEECKFSKDFPKKTPTTYLINHLKLHPELYQKYLDERTERETKTANAQQTIKRAFEKQTSSAETIIIDEIERPAKQQKIAVTIGMKNVWDKTGDKTMEANKLLLKMIATDIQPLSIVEKDGFKELMNFLQPKYKIPGRKYFTENLMPKIYNSLKKKIQDELDQASAISFTFDAWTSKDAAHSLLSLTGHFLQNSRPKFVILGVRPINGRHTADVLKTLLQEMLNEFDIREEKMFIFLRDAAETMVKVCADLGIRSFDCFAHKLNLCIWDGLRMLDTNENLQNLIEKIKKFIRKLRKSTTMRDEFLLLQKLNDLKPVILIKDTEVRWSSTYAMLDRFQTNETAIRLLSAQDLQLPKFSQDEFHTISALKEILTPIYNATNIVQNRETTISAVIPLYRVIIRALEKDKENFLSIKNAIIDGLKRRMDEKKDASGRIKRTAWSNNRDLILATMLDARFKMIYFEQERCPEYSEWLISEAEKSMDVEFRVSGAGSSRSAEPTTIENLFDDFENEARKENLLEMPLPSPEEFNARQKAELEVNEYLRAKKLNIKDDPFVFWSGENSAKWPLLTKLSQKYFSAPATSAESERLFSTAGLIVTNLRKKLLSENVEKLLFLHHNLKEYDINKLDL